MRRTVMVGVLVCSSCSDPDSERGGLDLEDTSPVGQGPDAGSSGPGGMRNTAGTGTGGQQPTTGGSNPNDQDGDGFTVQDGDCDDGAALVNPGAYDVLANDFDEDCDGKKATAKEAECETGLAIDSANAFDAARAIGLCKRTTESGKEWGVIGASYVRADGAGPLPNELMSGVFSSFGATEPLAGVAMLALSSGVARAPDQPGYTDRCDPFIDDDSSEQAGAFPEGFPRESPACRGTESGDLYDSAALELRLRVPTNVQSLAFDTNFFTYEYPDYICSRYNDFFVALLSSAPPKLDDGNIVFDAEGNLISVNNGLLQVCDPGTHGGRDFACPLGRDSLIGSGFEGTAACGTTDLGKGGTDDGGGKEGTVGAATGWLHTTAPIAPGSIITLRFAIWDSGDPVLDSTVLIDNFQWSAEVPEVETVPVVQ